MSLDCSPVQCAQRLEHAKSPLLGGFSEVLLRLWLLEGYILALSLSPGGKWDLISYSYAIEQGVTKRRE